MTHPRDLTSISNADVTALEEHLPKECPEAWSTLANILLLGLINTKQQGISRAEMVRIAVEQVQTIAHQLGGQAIYIPFGSLMLKKAMAEKIKSEFNGRNYLELASRHNISEMRVRQIVDADRPKARRARKGDENGSQPVPKRPKDEAQPDVATWPFKRL